MESKWEKLRINVGLFQIFNVSSHGEERTIYPRFLQCLTKLTQELFPK